MKTRDTLVLALLALALAAPTRACPADAATRCARHQSSLRAQDGALRVDGRFDPAELRQAAGVPLADLWRANRDQLLSGAGSRGLGQQSQLRFRLPSQAPASQPPTMTKSFQGGGGLMAILTGFLGLLFGLLGGGSQGSYPTSPGLLAGSNGAPRVNASTRGTQSTFGLPGLQGLGQGPGSRSGGWLDGSQNQSSAIGAGDPAPRPDASLRSGWIANDPTSGHPRITRGFGRKKHPISGKVKSHTGIDISKARGSGPQAYAVGPASVVMAKANGGYGNCVILKHADGHQTLYAHLASLSVSERTSIAPGTVVGPIGSTGYSTGPHLHFEVIRNGSKVDPKPYFPNYPYAD